MSETAKMREVIQEAFRQMDEYHYWSDPENSGFGPPGPPPHPTVEDVVKKLRDKTKTSKQKPKLEEPAGRIQVEVEKCEKPKPLMLGDLEVGETFSYPVGCRPENVYMVIRWKDDKGSYGHDRKIIQFVMLRTGTIYEGPSDTVIRRRACSLKVAP